MKKKICPGVFDAGHWAKNENNRNPPKNFPNIFVLLLLSKIKSKINSLAKCVCVIFWPANALCISIDYYTYRWPVLLSHPFRLGDPSAAAAAGSFYLLFPPYPKKYNPIQLAG
jgi:hypothetical protein